MRIGIFVAETWDAASPLAEVCDRARSAEACGLASGWVPYLPWALDSLAAVQAAGQAALRIDLGTAVIPTYLFHPLALARQAATVRAALGGRLILGIGCSNVHVIQMHGLPYERPARSVREYLEVLQRAARSEGQVVYEGEIYRPNGLYSTPDADSGPLLVGALGPAMLRAAGELSDGTIGTWCNEKAIAEVIAPQIRAAAEAAGRPAPRIGSVVPVSVTRDADRARERAAEHFAIYDGLQRYRRMVELGGLSRACEVCVIGDEAAVRERLLRFRDAGMTDFLAAPFAAGEDRQASWLRTAECLGALAASF